MPLKVRQKSPMHISHRRVLWCCQLQDGVPLREVLQGLVALPTERRTGPQMTEPVMQTGGTSSDTKRVEVGLDAAIRRSTKKGKARGAPDVTFESATSARRAGDDATRLLAEWGAAIPKAIALMSALFDVRTGATRLPADPTRLNALHIASLLGDGDVVRRLLLLGASANATDVEGTTALHLASTAGHVRHQQRSAPHA